jgi:hypothetical protein
LEIEKMTGNEIVAWRFRHKSDGPHMWEYYPVSKERVQSKTCISQDLSVKQLLDILNDDRHAAAQERPPEPHAPSIPLLSTVKPLEWSGTIGRAVFGAYRVSFNESGSPWGYPEMGEGYYVEKGVGFGEFVSGPHETRKSAERSADDDYKMRVLSALEIMG